MSAGADAPSAYATCPCFETQVQSENNADRAPAGMPILPAPAGGAEGADLTRAHAPHRTPRTLV